jgi:hypothetical protein
VPTPPFTTAKPVSFAMNRAGIEFIAATGAEGEIERDRALAFLATAERMPMSVDGELAQARSIRRELMRANTRIDELERENAGLRAAKR